AAKKFFRKLLKGCQYVPRVIITDKLKSYGAAKRELLPGVEHRLHRYLNNRAEVRLVGQQPNTPWCLGDWPWGPKRSGSRTPELDSSVGAIPTIRGEGLIHRPHATYDRVKSPRLRFADFALLSSFFALLSSWGGVALLMTRRCGRWICSTNASVLVCLSTRSSPRESCPTLLAGGKAP